VKSIRANERFEEPGGSRDSRKSPSAICAFFIDVFVRAVRAKREPEAEKGR